MTCMGHSAWTLALVMLASAAATAQDPPASLDPSFEVVSVKANPNDNVPEGIALQADGGLRFAAFPVRTLITIAYRSEGIQRFDQLVGAPSWISVDRFDIAAKAAANAAAPAAPNRLPLLLRSLLRDRFGLRVHAETPNMPAFALVMARRAARLGPQLRESIECPSASPAPPAANADPDRWCGIRAMGGVIS